MTIDALARKGRNVLIKITDDRKLGDISKRDVQSNTWEEWNALEDWDTKNGRKYLSKTVYFLINIQGRGCINTGKRKWKGKWSFINFYDMVVSNSRELH